MDKPERINDQVHHEPINAERQDELRVAVQRRFDKAAHQLHSAKQRVFEAALPQGWFYPEPETAVYLHAELLRELPPGHVLVGREVETIAWREGKTDDVLFRHTDAPDRFTVVHLSWLGRTEISSGFPTVEFDGTFAEFLAAEKGQYGVIPPEGT